MPARILHVGRFRLVWFKRNAYPKNRCLVNLFDEGETPKKASDVEMSGRSIKVGPAFGFSILSKLDNLEKLQDTENYKIRISLYFS